MKRLFLFLTFTLNGYIFADGHASPPMTAHYGFSTSNPAAVVESLQKFMASDCGKEMPARVTLFEPHFNGDNELHTSLLLTIRMARVWMQFVKLFKLVLLPSSF